MLLTETRDVYFSYDVLPLRIDAGNELSSNKWFEWSNSRHRQRSWAFEITLLRTHNWYQTVVSFSVILKVPRDL